MYKLVALYKVPQNVDDFEAYYRETHMPLTRKIPLLKEVRVSRVFGSPAGKSDYYLQAELCFKDKDDFKKAMSTPEAMASGKDLMGFAKDIVTVYFASEEVTTL